MYQMSAIHYDLRVLGARYSLPFLEETGSRGHCNTWILKWHMNRGMRNDRRTWLNDT